MHEIIFATHNAHKVEEVGHLLRDRFTLRSLSELGLHDDIPEPHDTLRENAEEKARVVFGWTNKNCFSEDTGLLVEVLDGEPGVRSARYAGAGHDFEANIGKLLSKLEGKSDRRARFLTVICLIYNGKEYIFEGECRGTIATERTGTKGFGYDPVFRPDASDRTFGQMDMEEKNQFSHRRKAVDELVNFLRKQ